jgi:hypothetical protein
LLLCCREKSGRGDCATDECPCSNFGKKCKRRVREQGVVPLERCHSGTRQLARARNPRPASGSMDFGLATLSRPGMTKTRVPSYSPPPPVSRSFPDVVSRLRRILDAGVTKASGEPRNCLTGKSDRLQIVRCPALFAKRLRFAPTPNHFYIHHRPVPQRGGSRSSRTRGRMRWTQVAPWTRALSCGRRSRVVLTPRRWRQVLEKQASQGRWWQESPVTRESAKEAVKTIARGMPGDSGVT